MKRALTFILTVVIAAAAGIAARTWLVSTVRIAGTSMADTLLSGDVVLTTRIGGEPEFGDVVECTFPGRSGSYVKRIVGLPGDTVEFIDGSLLRNGRPLSEPYVSSYTDDMRIELGEDEYFVLGDNRAESYDSRAEDMGCISRSRILAAAQWILWPIDRFGPVE